MSEIITVYDYHLVPDDGWEPRLQAARDAAAGATMAAFIEFGKEVHAFRQHCERSQGGSQFTRRGRQWLGISSSMLHDLANVGRRAAELSSNAGRFPNDLDAVRKVASLGDDDFHAALCRIKPAMSRDEVRALIREIRPPRPQPEPNFYKAALRLMNEIEKLPAGIRKALVDELVEREAEAGS